MRKVRKMKRVIVIIVLMFLILYGCEGKKTPMSLVAGVRAPDFTLSNYDGKPISLSNYKGKIIVLEWFNYDCPFCKCHYDAGIMTKVANKYKGNNVVWLAVNSTKYANPKMNREFAKEYKVSYPMLDDKRGDIGRAYGAERTPHVFIVDTNGFVAYAGAIDNSPLCKTPKGQTPTNYVDKALAELVEGKAVTIANTKSYGCTIKYR